MKKEDVEGEKKKKDAMSASPRQDLATTTRSTLNADATSSSRIRGSDGKGRHANTTSSSNSTGEKPMKSLVMPAANTTTNSNDNEDDRSTDEQREEEDLMEIVAKRAASGVKRITNHEEQKVGSSSSFSRGATATKSSIQIPPVSSYAASSSSASAASAVKNPPTNTKVKHERPIDNNKCADGSKETEQQQQQQQKEVLPTTLSREPRGATHLQLQQQRPGAFAVAPGTADLSGSLDSTTATTINNLQELLQAASTDQASDSILNYNSSSNSNSNNNSNLVEALPVEGNEQYHHHDSQCLAIDSFTTSQHGGGGGGATSSDTIIGKTKEKHHMILILGFCLAVGVVSLIVVLLAVTSSAATAMVGLGRIHNNNPPNKTAAASGTLPTTQDTNSKPRLPPPMGKNLELLYHELPEKTKESLYDTFSPQYQAWEWILHHPYISTYPEWRKNQVFAMATVFFSLEGPNWPEETPNKSRWMDVNGSECSWVMSEEEVDYWVEQNAFHLGPTAYPRYAVEPCNSRGELQNLFVHNLYLPSINWMDKNSAPLKPSIPPEIELLSSIRIFGTGWSRLGKNVKLSDLIIPEVTQLPNLQLMNFLSSGAHGTIPQQLFTEMTNLRHLIIGSDNALTGSIFPSSYIGKMTSLEWLIIGDEKNLVGTLPSELGLLTGLTHLELYRTSVTGSIPTELGLLSRLKTFRLDGNQLFGSIPRELGSLTANTWLALHENRLNSSIPTELGLMTDTLHLRLWNNALTGSVPSELGFLTHAVEISVGNHDATLLSGPYNNNFTGSLPTELWNLSHMEKLYLPNLPNLRGQIPLQIAMPNLTTFSLLGSPHITGTVPDQACVLFVDDGLMDFDCSDTLCGCDCPCPVSTINQTIFN